MSRLRDARRTAARHAPLLAVLAAGTALRALAWASYQPALFYSDSVGYLQNTGRAPGTGWHPPGYPLFLDPLVLGRHLALVSAVQHLLGLGCGIAIYALVVRLTGRRWLATSAALPVLLDAYQVQIEQYVLSEALFETLLVTAVCLALWQARTAAGRLSSRRAVAVGLVIAAAALVRLDAAGLLLPLLGWTVWAVLRNPAGPRRWLPVVAVGLAVLLPLGAMAGLRAGAGDGASVSADTPLWLYSRVAPFADCGSDAPTPAERVLCPTAAMQARHGSIWFQNSPNSPVKRYFAAHPDGGPVAEAFARRVIVHQPLDYLATVARDFADQFRPVRDRTADGPEFSPWRFRLTLAPVDPTKPFPQQVVDGWGTGRARLWLPGARILRAYQSAGYLPGPVVAVLLGLSLVALVRGRRHRLAPGVLLLAGSAVIVVLVATALVTFSWRYVLPTLVLAPPAGALALAVLLDRPRRERPDTERGGDEQRDHAGDDVDLAAEQVGGSEVQPVAAGNPSRQP
jgi:hypothetical protein